MQKQNFSIASQLKITGLKPNKNYGYMIYRLSLNYINKIENEVWIMVQTKVEFLWNQRAPNPI